MNNEVLDSYARGLAFKAERTMSAQFTKFLDPCQQSIIKKIFANDTEIHVGMYGGYDDAERKVAAFYNSCFDEDKIEMPYELLDISWNSKFNSIKHKDILGAIMSSGIVREAIGDIVIKGDHAYVFVLNDLIVFLKDNLNKIKNTHVNTKIIDTKNIDISCDDKKLLNITAASVRADAVISSGFGISRDKSSDFIKRGLVQVNWENIIKSDYSVNINDVLSVRGLGRLKIKEVGYITKKGRVHIIIEKYH